jgi:hypothetical protein
VDVRLFLGALWKRWWASLSSAALTVLGLYALATNKTNSWVVWASLSAAAAMLLLASALAWNDEHKRALVLEGEVERLKLAPAQFKIRPIELRRNDPHSTRKRDVFVQAKVELITPIEVDVVGYALELSRDGVIEELEVGNDVSEWNLYIDSSFDSVPMRPLPRRLRSGQGAEGWVHFLTERTNYELESGRLRLSIQTSRGDGNVEIPCTSEYWNPTRTTIVMPRC